MKPVDRLHLSQQKFYLSNCQIFLCDVEDITPENIEKLVSFLKKGVPSINSYIFSPDESLTDLLQLFEEQALIFDGAFPNPPADKLICEFGDWAWYDLRTYTCSTEAKIMDHCGNSEGNEGQTIFTLRKRITECQDIGLPFATFIFDIATGSLGEMKGRHNLKPQKCTHRAIVELFLQIPEIKSIIGGGYRPENNFALSELSPDLFNLLANERPDLIQ